MLINKKKMFNPFISTVQTFAVGETDVSRHNGGTSGAPLKPLRDDSALKALSSLRGLRGAPEVPPLCRETSVSRTANVGTVGKNGLMREFLNTNSVHFLATIFLVHLQEGIFGIGNNPGNNFYLCKNSTIVKMYKHFLQTNH